MENETKTPEPEQENQVPEEEKTADQPGWFQDFVDHYDVDKPQQGNMLKGKILISLPKYCPLVGRMA